MKLIRYYPKTLLPYYASLKLGDKAVIVERTEQPPEGWKLFACGSSEVIFFGSETVNHLKQVRYTLPFPVGATVGMPETWTKAKELSGKINYYYKLNPWDVDYIGNKDKWRSPATMPNSAIRLLFEVTETRVCQVKEVGPDTQRLMGFEPYSSNPSNQFHFWFIGRYSQMDWENNVWVQVVEMERTGKT